MGIKKDLQKKKEYSIQEKNTLKNPTVIKIQQKNFYIEI